MKVIPRILFMRRGLGKCPESGRCVVAAGVRVFPTGARRYEARASSRAAVLNLPASPDDLYRVTRYSRAPTCLVLLVVLGTAGSWCTACRPPSQPVAASLGTSTDTLVVLDEKRVRDRFVEQIVSPLKEWRFIPDTKRYFLASRIDDINTATWSYVKTYEVSDLEWRVTPRDSVLTPFVGEVTFRSRISFTGPGGDPDIPAHEHRHVYVFKGDHWRLQSQRYSVGTATADCLVGHLDKAAWRIEALCVDEAERLIKSPLTKSPPRESAPIKAPPREAPPREAPE
ncbi:MAG: hypothetical protein AB1486_07550 [Planctomycetota bacterium]